MSPEVAVKVLKGFLGFPREKGPDGLFLDNDRPDTSHQAVLDATYLALQALEGSLSAKSAKVEVKITPPVK